MTWARDRVEIKYSTINCGLFNFLIYKIFVLSLVLKPKQNNLHIPTFLPLVANNLCLMHISTPNSKSSIRIRAEARCAEKCRNPIITLFFRDTFVGTKVIAATKRKKAPVEDTYECSSKWMKASFIVLKKLFRWSENVSSRKMWSSLH